MKSASPLFRRTPKPWRMTGTRQVASLGKVKLHEDDIVSTSGFRTKHVRLSLHDFAIIVPVLDRKRLVFIWNYRHPIQGWELELPAGLMNDGEDPQTCARRELQEETGYSAKSWKNIGWLHTTPGISAQRAHVFLATNLRKGKARLESYERMGTRIITVKNAYRLLHEGKLVHSSTVSALSLAERTLLTDSKNEKSLRG